MRFSQGVIFLAVVALTLFISFPSSSAFGQSISITYPTGTTSVNEGADFFTDNGRPLNGTDSNQISWRENLDETTVRSTGGVWTGTNSAAGGYLFPLFGGFFGAMYPKGLQSDKTFPLMGGDTPVNATKYHLLSYRLNHTSRSTNAIYWNNDKSQSLWPNPENKCVNFDGIYNGLNSHTIAGYRIYNYDLADLNSCEVKGSGTWSGTVNALRLDPSVFGPAGSVTQLDWLRLVDPDSAPELPIYWDSSSIPNNSVIALYVDNNNSGFDGTPVKFFTNNSDPGVYNFPTAALPPGTHYFYLRVLEKVTLNVLATSGYSGKLLINQTPSLKITSPSEVTGREYAKDEVGNPWDMSGTDDIANFQVSNKWPAAWHQFANEKVSGGVFRATASAPLPGAPHGDAAVVLNVPANKPIDTTLYRYLTYRIAVDPASYPTTSKFVEHGAVFRPIAWNTDVVADGVNHKAHQILTGPGNTAMYYTYTVDLYQNPEYGTKWQAAQYRNYLRLDPFENTGSNGIPGAPVPNPWFYIDDVKLTTDNYPTNGIYAMQFSVTDPDSSLISYSIYRDTDNVGFNGKLIISKTNIAPGNFTVNWNTNGLPAGKKHWLYWVITDASGNVSRSYAQVPVVTGALPAKVVASKKMDDVDGDGVSDPIVYRPAIAFYRNGSTIGQNSIGFGDIYSTAVNADIDGDRATDNGIYVPNNGQLKWYFIRSSDGGIYPRSWGVVGDKPVLGDYDNDGVDDVAIYRPSTGEWFVNFASGGSKMQQWGKNGDIPVPADYDGDGKTDFAIWRPSDGTWWILNSGFATKKTSASYSKYQWGLNGDMPVPGDWFGTGKAYPAVWRPSNGTWYLRNIGGSSGSYTSYQFGLPGDIPLVGYYNKLKPNELTPTVYRASTGTWFNYTRSNAAVGMQQWGMPGDQVPAYRFK